MEGIVEITMPTKDYFFYSTRNYKNTVRQAVFGKRSLYGADEQNVHVYNEPLSVEDLELTFPETPTHVFEFTLKLDPTKGSKINGLLNPSTRFFVRDVDFTIYKTRRIDFTPF